MKDEYAWLEKLTDPRVVKWARSQDRAARRSVQKGSKALYGRLGAAYSFPIMRSVQLTKAGIFLFYSDERSYKVELMDREGCRKPVADSVALGKGAVIQGVQARPDGGAIALHYSIGGSDEGTVAVIDLSSRERVDELHGFVGSLLWRGDGSYYYVREYLTEKAPDGVPPPATRVLLREGARDPVVFGSGFDTNTFVGVSPSAAGDEALVDVVHGWARSRPHAGGIGDPESWAPVYPETGSMVTWVDRVGGESLLLSFEKGLGQVVSAGPGRARTVVREGRWPLQEAALVGDKVLCHYLVDARSELRFFGLDGRPGRALKFPVPGSLAAQTGAGVSACGDEAVVSFSSFAFPYAVYVVRASGLTKVASVEVPGRYTVSEGRAVSADGTRIHYFMTRRAGSTKRKALLFGYGGFRVSVSPSFNPAYLPLLEDGGAFAVANLRGGLERGEEWHRAGMRGRKHKVFEDYVAVLTALRRKGMDVVGFGRSNGGLLMGATMNMRPDLFAGVLIGYPVLDMSAFARLLAGRAWVPEYGDPEIPADRRFLLKYSPYHNIRKGRKYPPTFIYTGLKDDRVHPGHAFKFFARLRDAGADVKLRVELESGHIGTTPETRIGEEADKLAFVYGALGMDPVGTKPRR